MVLHTNLAVAPCIALLLLVLLCVLPLRAAQKPILWSSRTADQKVCASSRSEMPSANARWYKVGDALLVLSEGDITAWSGDAVVNAGGTHGHVLACRV